LVLFRFGFVCFVFVSFFRFCFVFISFCFVLFHSLINCGDISAGERHVLTRDAELKAAFTALPADQQKLLQRTAERIRVRGKRERRERNERKEKEKRQKRKRKEKEKKEEERGGKRRKEKGIRRK
jgi:hypothetical protein